MKAKISKKSPKPKATAKVKRGRKPGGHNAHTLADLIALTEQMDARMTKRDVKLAKRIDGPAIKVVETRELHTLMHAMLKDMGPEIVYPPMLGWMKRVEVEMAQVAVHLKDLSRLIYEATGKDDAEGQAETTDPPTSAPKVANQP